MPGQLKTAESYLTNEDLAARYKVGLGTVREWRARGTGPAVTKLGGLVRYAIEDVFAWETSRREAGRSTQGA